MTLSYFIRKNIEEILKEWEEFARSLPPGKDMEALQLQDHARKLLETIAEDMIPAQSGAEQEDKSKGEGRLMEQSRTFAKKHVSTRQEEDFDLSEIVAEYRALRATVIRLWRRNMKTADLDTLDDLTRFNEGIDQALTYAVQEILALAERTRKDILNKLQDSQERYRAIAESLQETDRYKDEFLAILAHELRNPLAPIQTGIEVLRLTEGMPAEVEAPLNMMERQTVHLVRLVDDLLDISRISRGKINLRLEALDVADVIRKAVEATAARLHAGRREVSINLPAPQALVVQGDAVRLVQVVGNLLSNAAKHTDESGHIWISAKQDGQHARIVVRDDGTGIAPEQVGDLFKMFKQLDATRREGLGIGLALAQKLVELHGGSVTGCSAGLGRGSEFTVCLPLLQSGQKAAPSEKGGDNVRLDAVKVLVVDDNQDAAKSLDLLLQLLGAQPRLAHDGPSALAQLEEFQPDLVLLDIGLPGMNGYEVARRMRDHPEAKNVRIVAVTGWGQDEDRQQSLRAGINQHLVKPINLQDIKSVMESLKHE